MITNKEFQPVGVETGTSIEEYKNPDDLVGYVWRGPVVADIVVRGTRELGPDLSDRHLRILAKCGTRGARRCGDDVVAQEYERVKRHALRMLRDRLRIP